MRIVESAEAVIKYPARACITLIHSVCPRNISEFSPVCSSWVQLGIRSKVWNETFRTDIQVIVINISILQIFQLEFLSWKTIHFQVEFKLKIYKNIPGTCCCIMTRRIHHVLHKGHSWERRFFKLNFQYSTWNYWNVPEKCWPISIRNSTCRSFHQILP